MNKNLVYRNICCWFAQLQINPITCSLSTSDELGINLCHFTTQKATVSDCNIIALNRILSRTRSNAERRSSGA